MAFSNFFARRRNNDAQESAQDGATDDATLGAVPGPPPPAHDQETKHRPPMLPALDPDTKLDENEQAPVNTETTTTTSSQPELNGVQRWMHNNSPSRSRREMKEVDGILARAFAVVPMPNHAQLAQIAGMHPKLTSAAVATWLRQRRHAWERSGVIFYAQPVIIYTLSRPFLPNSRLNGKLLRPQTSVKIYNRPLFDQVELRKGIGGNTGWKYHTQLVVQETKRLFECIEHMEFSKAEDRAVYRANSINPTATEETFRQMQDIAVDPETLYVVGRNVAPHSVEWTAKMNEQCWLDVESRTIRVGPERGAFTTTITAWTNFTVRCITIMSKCNRAQTSCHVGPIISMKD